MKKVHWIRGQAFDVITRNEITQICINIIYLIIQVLNYRDKQLHIQAKLLAFLLRSGNYLILSILALPFAVAGVLVQQGEGHYEHVIYYISNNL